MQIREHLLRGLAPQEVGRVTSTSTTTVYRVLKAMPWVDSNYRRRVKQASERAKQDWQSLKDERPNSTQTQLRLRASATFAQLYRHERQWLRHATPAATRRARLPRRRPRIPLAALTHSVRDAERILDTAEGPPARKSAYRLRLMLGVSEYALNSSLARTSRGGFTQSRDEHVTDRIAWVARGQRSVQLKEWRVARAAKLRQSTVRQLKTRRLDELNTRKNEQRNSLSRDKNPT
ncbi:TnsD family Tn7-like transposition protein [Pararobbsia alpina]|uniref:TnsD family Tn7-like transposition protein n=1 Tax=Pararobbsia alpina TaxID=621374 RepID=UPI0039A67346